MIQHIEYSYLIPWLLVLIMTYGFHRYRKREIKKRWIFRNGIAQDLHDQIGATLTSISTYAKVAGIYHQQQRNTELDKLLKTINNVAVETISEMSDIVWAVNPGNDNVESIVQKISAYAQPLCTAQNIRFLLKCDKRVFKQILEMDSRKNFFLILKEALNNALKHAACTELMIDIRLKKHYIQLIVKDDGRGMDCNELYMVSASAGSGNGLGNMKARAKQMGGKLIIESECGQGTRVSLLFSIFRW